MINVFPIVSCLKETINRVHVWRDYEIFRRRNVHIINMGEENGTDYQNKIVLNIYCNLLSLLTKTKFTKHCCSRHSVHNKPTWYSKYPGLKSRPDCEKFSLRMILVTELTAGKCSPE